jgi:hypothetical protein
VADLIRESLDSLDTSDARELLASLERTLRDVGLHAMAYRLQAMSSPAADPVQAKL